MTTSDLRRIGICGELLPSSLKHLLLFFDRIAVYELENSKKLSRSFSSPRGLALANDLEFLESKNIAFDPGGFQLLTNDPPPKGFESPPDEELAQVCSLLLRDVQISEQKKRYEQSEKAARSAEASKLFDLMLSHRQFFARLHAIEMQLNGLTASAVLSQPLIVPEEFKRDLRDSSATVVEVVLSKLPMPSEQTPWEQILDFKEDADAQGYLHGLRTWMSDLTRQNFTALEAEEKLEWLLFQHEQHLKAHKLTYRWGTFGAAFVATTEILEDLIKFRWGKAASGIVSIVDRRIELLKAEITNPSKEINYIVKAQERFSQESYL